MSEKLTRGCVVFMKASSGLMGYGNGQCVSDVCEQLGTISLFGHNQHYNISDIDRVAEYTLQSRLTQSEAENIEWQEQIAELCIESASQGVKMEKSEAEVKTLTLFHEDAKKQIKTATDRWNDLREELKVCEECGNTTEIEGDNYLIWCKTCWEKVVADNKRLSAIYEDWKSMEGELTGALLKLTTATDTIKRLREENRWIPVGEGLPQPDETTHPQQSVTVKLTTITEIDAWYEDCDKHWHSSRTGEVIKGTHWRPATLPEQEGAEPCPSQ